MPFRLAVGLKGLSPVPYATDNADYGTCDRSVASQGVPPLCYYALRSILRALDTRELLVQSEIELLDLWGQKRVPCQDGLLEHLYPNEILAYTSPMKWYLLCSLLHDLPERFCTFELPLSDPFVVAFQRLPEHTGAEHHFITTLCLSGTPIGDDIFSPICKLRSLRGLDLSRANVTDGGFKKFLRTIELNNISYGEPGPTGLQALLLGGCKKITSEVAQSFKSFRQLQYVDLRECGDIDEPEDVELPEGFTLQLPDPLEPSDDLPSIVRSLHALNQASSKEDLPLELLVLSITSLDYPHVPKPLAVTPMQAHSEGWFYVSTPNGGGMIGNAEALALTQEEMFREGGKPLPERLFAAAMGKSVGFGSRDAKPTRALLRSAVGHDIGRALKIPPLKGSLVFYRAYDSIPSTAAPEKAAPVGQPRKAKPIFEKAFSSRQVDFEAKRKKLLEKAQSAATARDTISSQQPRQLSPPPINPFRLRKK